MRKPIIVINMYSRNYSGYISLGKRVVDYMTANLHFPAPAPTLFQLQSAITETVEAYAAWGIPGNRGSHTDLIKLRVKTLTLAQLLKAMSQYVQNTAQLIAGNDYPLMTSIMSTSGFELKRTNSPQGTLQPVVGLHALFPRYLRRNQVMVQWSKPPGVLHSINVKVNKVYRGNTPSFSDAEIILTTTKTSFIDTNSSPETVTWYYWIVPVGAAGDGAISNVLQVKLLGI